MKTAETKAGLAGRIIAGVCRIEASEWDACLPDEVENWHYYRACESQAGPCLTAAAEIRDEKGLVIAVPLFRLSYRLDTPFQGKLSKLGQLLTKAFPKLMEFKLLGVGSPYTDRCHVVFRSGLTPDEKASAIKALVTLIEEEAKQSGVTLIAYKDLCGLEYDALFGLLRQSGYHRLRSLPIAALTVPAGKQDTYLGTLSSSTRKEIRRKLKSTRNIIVEHRFDLSGIEHEISALYESTKKQSVVRYDSFEDLPENYFKNVSAELKDRALFILYWIDGRLAAFNLLLLEQDRVIDKFLGMAYPLARENNLYIVSWMENVSFCQATGRTILQSGQTAYSSKLRLGSELIPAWVFVKHRNAIMSFLIRLLSPVLAFDRWDPDLRKARAGGRVRQ